jgi:hypothetical protein
VNVDTFAKGVPPMKPIQFWSWSLKRLEGRGRYVMRGKYTEKEAFSYFHGQDPQKVDGSEEVRNCPETAEEELANQTSTALSNWYLQQAGAKGAARRP